MWAPVTVAALFVLGGSYLFWTPDYERAYRWTDIGVLLTAAGLALAAFLAGSTAVIDHWLPDRFPTWEFWSGVALGVAAFVAAERRAGDGDVPWRPHRRTGSRGVIEHGLQAEEFCHALHCEQADQSAILHDGGGR